MYWYQFLLIIKSEILNDLKKNSIGNESCELKQG